MRKILLITGALLLLINTFVGLIFSEFYATHQMLFGDFSIALTTLLLYASYQINTVDGFRIGNTLLLCISGFFRFICAVTASDQTDNNFSLLLFVVILCIEVLLIFISNIMRKK